jgi:pimeloyl-ACP methyl ester carboxylesterase
MGGLSVPLVAAARPVRRLVLLAALLVDPGRSFFDQLSDDTSPFVPGVFEGLERDDRGRSFWADREAAARALYGETDRETAEAALARLRPQAPAPQDEPCPLSAWPAVPTDAIVCADDRIVAPDVSRRLLAERLGLAPRDLPGDHSPMLSRPAELADLLADLAR